MRQSSKFPSHHACLPGMASGLSVYHRAYFSRYIEPGPKLCAQEKVRRAAVGTEGTEGPVPTDTVLGSSSTALRSSPPGILALGNRLPGSVHWPRDLLLTQDGARVVARAESGSNRLTCWLSPRCSHWPLWRSRQPRCEQRSLWQRAEGGRHLRA